MRKDHGRQVACLPSDRLTRAELVACMHCNYKRSSHKCPLLAGVLGLRALGLTLRLNAGRETRFADDETRAVCQGRNLLIPRLLLLETKCHSVQPLAPFMHLV